MCARHVDSINPGRSNLVFRSDRSRKLRCRIGLLRFWSYHPLCFVSAVGGVFLLLLFLDSGIRISSPADILSVKSVLDSFHDSLYRLCIYSRTPVFVRLAPEFRLHDHFEKKRSSTDASA